MLNFTYTVALTAMLDIIYSFVILLGNDFNPTTQTVTIVAGTNSSMVNIPVTVNNIVEGDETFSMSLTVPSSLGPRIVAGAITSATVTIVDTSSELHHTNMHCFDLLFQALE